MTASGLDDRLLKLELVFCAGFFRWELRRQRSVQRVSLEVSIPNRRLFFFPPLLLMGGEETNDLNLLWRSSRGLEGISGTDKRLTSSLQRGLLDCLAAEGECFCHRLLRQNSDVAEREMEGGEF